MQSDIIDVRFGSLEIKVPIQAATRGLLEMALPDTAAAGAVMTKIVPPANLSADIGAEVDGAIYAGITLVGSQVAHLYLLPGDEKMEWKDAGAWAEKQGGVLPSRMDALVLWQNLPKQFKEEWYWTSEQSAVLASYAWVQSFSDGSQGYFHEGYDCRVRAVRRVIIQ